MMPAKAPSSAGNDTFHAGEVALQAEAGVAERMARLGAQMIRGYLPEQHRAFFESLPFVLAGSLDATGQPTASLLAAPPGFAWSPDAHTLRIDARPMAGDPLESNLRAGVALGLLGIQLHTRRRNRANGRVSALDAGGFTLRVEQSFGNCPRHIRAREAFYSGTGPPHAVQELTALGERERALVASADTFFIASAHPDAAMSRASAHGVDVSHRGGPPGFALFTSDDTFLVPDYRGNNLFNTLGNLRLNPRAGLLFLERARGDLLQLEATVDTVIGAHPHAGPEPSGRNVRFRIRRVRFFPEASSLRFGPDV
jgi:predicted pyridoxine 5'-phosphate oxidase superfamily flavin-nucleotide-binding protein